ncbi:rhodanese-like domain-containing protein [Bacillus massilinigeriensis]|uniref:rhodanese-like domain-containing protein n=1 Tax=Bacillus mediterraneensis TaxID=1805474 RepID=UPI0008F9097C|nr:rhodanese-like domain-containing protein [Bacillus mediterraneensis]
MTVKRILPEELKRKIDGHDKVMLLDVRAAEKYDRFHIEEPGVESKNIFKEEILGLSQEALRSLPKDREIIVTCTTGNSAARCAAVLSEKEYDVAVLDGGITAWKEYLSKK